MLDLEQRHPTPSTSKDAVIIREFGLSSARYYQLLIAAVAKPEVIEAYPLEVHRISDGIQRRKDARAHRH